MKQEMSDMNCASPSAFKFKKQAGNEAGGCGDNCSVSVRQASARSRSR